METMDKTESSLMRGSYLKGLVHTEFSIMKTQEMGRGFIL